MGFAEGKVVGVVMTSVVPERKNVYEQINSISGASLRTRLTTGIGSLVIVAAITIGVAVWSVSDLVQSEKVIAEKSVPYLGALSDIAISAKTAANDERGFLLTGKTSFADSSKKNFEVEKAKLAEARAAASTASQEAAIDTIAEELGRFNDALEEEFALYATNRAQVIEASLGRNRDLRKVYEASINKAIKDAKTYVRQETQEQEHLATKSRNILLTLLVVMIGLGAVFTWLLNRAVNAPLTSYIAVLETAARGDLTIRAAVYGPRELRRMAQATNQMLQATENIVGTIATRAESLSSTAAQLAGINEHIASSTMGVAELASNVSSATEQVTSSVQTVATAAEEMGSTIVGIANAANTALTATTEAVKAASVVRETISKLDESSAEIGMVVKTISSIADQTSLLALNATIEAARAGDAGKGFEVVAGEVKDLAMETSRATSDITGRINAIQNDVHEVIQTIAQVTDIIGKINNHQISIASAVEEQSAMAQDVARSVTEAANGTTDIAQNITTVAQAVGSITDETGQAKTTADSVAETGSELRGLVKQFTINHNAT